MDDDIALALLNGEDIETGTKRAILRAAVVRQIICVYTGEVLDVRRAVLIDGSDYQRADGSGRGKMDIMPTRLYDILLEKVGGVDGLREKLGYDFGILDGRELFK